MTDCIFCRIVSGQLPGTIVHRDDLCTAFLDIQPVNPGHVLIVPNCHATYLADLPADTGAHMFRIAQSLATALRKCGVRCEGVNFFLADGEAAMQKVFHVHLHVFPRFAGDGFGLTFGPNYRNRPERRELDRIANQLCIALQINYLLPPTP